MTEKEYNAAPGVRRSELWKLKRSPKHYRFEKENPPEATPALVFGSAVHCMVLTPEAMSNQYTVLDIDGRTKEGKAARAAAAESGKTVLTMEQAQTVMGIKEALESDRYAVRLLTGEHEIPHFWTDELTGEQCKCRTDCETDINGTHYIVDLKTCNDASTEGFMRDAIKLGYHVQAAMYSEGVRLSTGKESVFVFIAVEKDKPYAINILQPDDAFMLYGMDEYRRLLGLYHECRTRDFWPGYGGLNSDINTLELPAWLRKGVE